MKWTIDAVIIAPVRLILREPLANDKVDQSRWAFLNSMEPYVKRNVLPSVLYSILEKGGA